MSGGPSVHLGAIGTSGWPLVCLKCHLYAWGLSVYLEGPLVCLGPPVFLVQGKVILLCLHVTAIRRSWDGICVGLPFIP